MGVDTIKEMFLAIKKNVAGLDQLLVITDDGFPVVSTLDTGEAEVRSTAVAAILCDSGQRGIKELDLGELEALITLGTGGYFVLMRIRPGILFMAIAAPEVSLGLVLLRMKRAKPSLIEVFAGH
jgi:predicted regulator of Ras-like GTPase activity (Roadblock/LC7/MglB family)